MLSICCHMCVLHKSVVPESSEILSGVLGLAGRCSTSTWISSVSSGLVRRRGLLELAFLLRGLLLCSLLLLPPPTLVLPLLPLLPPLLPPLLSPGSLRSTRSRAVDRTEGGQRQPSSLNGLFETPLTERQFGVSELKCFRRQRNQLQFKPDLI